METKKSMFKDVPNDHWAVKAIEELAERGIIKGYPDGIFKPDEPITRAEAAIIQQRYHKWREEHPNF